MSRVTPSSQGRLLTATCPAISPFASGSAASGGGGGGRGGSDGDQRDGQSTAPSAGMLVAVQVDETGKPKPPGAPPGGLGDGRNPGGGGGGGPNGPNAPMLQPCSANRMGPNWGTFGSSNELNLVDIPSVQTLQEWKQHCVRVVAGAWHDVKAAQ
eukprot:3665295-Pyramimonas_sp.AAC.1